MKRFPNPLGPSRCPRALSSKRKWCGAPYPRSATPPRTAAALVVPARGRHRLPRRSARCRSTLHAWRMPPGFSLSSSATRWSAAPPACAPSSPARASPAASPWTGNRGTPCSATTWGWNSSSASQKCGGLPLLGVACASRKLRLQARPSGGSALLEGSANPRQRSSPACKAPCLCGAPGRCSNRIDGPPRTAPKSTLAALDSSACKSAPAHSAWRGAGALTCPANSAAPGCVVRWFVKRSGSNSMVESQPSKLLVAGSIPVSRSNACPSQIAWPGRRRPRGIYTSVLDE